MSKEVITFVADDAYLDHARSVLVNCRRQGGWEGDFCMISPQGCNAGDFRGRGIEVLEIPQTEWNFMAKFWIFTPFFHRWDRALCIDLDIMVQGPLKKIFDGLGPRLPLILCGKEDGPTLQSLKHWDKAKGEGPDAHPEVYERLQARYPHVTERTFNMGIIFYEPRSMPPQTKDELLAVHEEFKQANPSEADQMIVNLHLYPRLAEAGKDYWCFMGHDYPGNRIPSEFRGWRGDEEPVILHYTRWHAPWIVKQKLNPEMGGYRNHRLGRICHELYAENLAAFNEVFPHV